MLDGVVVARGVARLHEDRKAPPGPAVAVQSGGDRDHHEVVLLAAQRRAERRQHPGDRVIDAVEFDAIADRGTKREERFRQTGAEHANVMRRVHVGVDQRAALGHGPVARRKIARRHAEHADRRRRLFVARGGLAVPKNFLQPDVAGEGRPFLHLPALRQGDVLAPPEFFKSLRSAEINLRPFPDLKGVAAQRAELLFNIVLQHAHRRHHHDNGEHPDQHAEQGQPRAQFMRRQRAHRHEETLFNLSAEDGQCLIHF